MQRFLLAIFLTLPLFAQNAVLPPAIHDQYLDKNGKPLGGGKIFTCFANVSCPGNPLVTYQDSAATTSNANPVILDYTGYAAIRLRVSSAYKFVAYDRNNVLQWEVDNINSPLLSFPSRYSAPDYNFTTAAIGSITPGANTITLLFGPAGVKGTDAKHFVRLVGGVGTAETVLLTGGSCVPGAFNCTLQFTAANTHTGLWTMTSANGGVTEAEYQMLYLHPTGGKVYMPAGTYTFYGAAPFKDGVTFIGDGDESALIPATCSSTFFDADIPVKATTESHLVEDNIAFKNFLIDGSSCPGVNTLTGINQTNSPSSTEVFSLAGLTIDGVYLNNVFNGVHLERSFKVNIRNTNLYQNSSIVFTDSQTTSGYNNTYTLLDNVRYSYQLMHGDGTQVSMMRSPLVCISCEVLYVTNSHWAGRPIANTSAFNIVGGENFVLTGSEFSSWFFVVQLSKTAYVTGNNFYPGYITFANNTVDAIWSGAFNIQQGTSASGTALNHVGNLIIANSQFTNAFTNGSVNPIFINITDFTKNVTLSGNLFTGIDSSDFAVKIAAGADNITFDKSNVFSNEAGTYSPTTTAISISSTAGAVYGLEQLRPVGFDVAISDPAATKASATTLTLPIGRTQVTVTGSTNINAIVAQPAGRTVILSFPGALTVATGGNLELHGVFTTSGFATGTLTLLSDGTNWIELSRSVN